MDIKKAIESAIKAKGYQDVDPPIPFHISKRVFDDIVTQVVAAGGNEQETINALIHRYFYGQVVAYRDQSYDLIYPDKTTVHFPPKNTYLSPSLDYSKFRVCVVGDMMIDVWMDAVEDGTCPEGRKNYNVKDFIASLGGAGNLVEVLEKLGADISFFTVDGKDLTQLDDFVPYATDNARLTTTKIRLDGLRISLETIDDIDEESEQQILAPVVDGTWDAVVISDYGKGVLTRNVIEVIGEYCEAKGIYLFVDPKFKNWDLYLKYADIIKCNLKEWESAAGVIFEDKNKSSIIVTTSGSKGYTIANIIGGKHFPATKVDAVDICGAGDVFMGVMVLEYLRTLDIYKACELANYAAGLSVTHKGTYRPSVEELVQYGSK